MKDSIPQEQTNDIWRQSATSDRSNATDDSIMRATDILRNCKKVFAVTSVTNVIKTDYWVLGAENLV